MVACFLGFSFSNAAEHAPLSSTFSRSQPGVVIKVDKREELFCILFRLAGASEYQDALPTQYVREVDVHFRPFQDHPAVKATQVLYQTKKIQFDAPQNLLVYLDEQFMLRQKLSPLPLGMQNRWEGIDIDDYLEKIRDFVRVSHANDFFAAHSAYYRKVEERFHDAIPKINQIVAWFDPFFGVKSNASNIIIPGLLTGESSYGIKATLENKQVENYQVLQLTHLDQQDLPNLDLKKFELLIVHELGHSYINPKLERYRTLFQPHFESIIKLVRKPMKRQGYNAISLINESVVRAATALYVKEIKGEKAFEEEAHKEAYRSYLWVKDLAILLEKYKKEQNQYPSFDAFIPELNRFFREVAQQYATKGLPKRLFFRPIEAVAQNGSIIVKPKKSVQTEKLNKYVDTIWREEFPAGVRVEVGERDLADFQKTDVVLYGSPLSNPLIDKILRQNHWQVHDHGISVAGKHFEGSDLVLIVCKPHPQNPYQGVLVYTAANDSDLVGINSLSILLDDWVVAKHLSNGQFKIMDEGRL